MLLAFLVVWYFASCGYLILLYIVVQWLPVPWIPCSGVCLQSLTLVVSFGVPKGLRLVILRLVLVL